jgi:hypothetical protein
MEIDSDERSHSLDLQGVLAFSADTGPSATSRTSFARHS